MAIITGNITPTGQGRSKKYNGQGTKVLLMASSDCLPSQPTKDGRAVSPQCR